MHNLSPHIMDQGFDDMVMRNMVTECSWQRNLKVIGTTVY